MNIEILKFTIQDLNEIKNILETDFDDFWNYNTLKSELENPISHYIVAKQDGKIVGFAGIMDTLDQMEITNIVVKKDSRNMGIGNTLLKYLISMSKGKEFIYLEVNEKNESAIKLYKKNGFKKCGLRKKYYNGTYDGVLMKLKSN